MALNGGTPGGTQIISRASLALMTRTQSGDIKTGFTDGMSWRFGFQVVREPQGITPSLSPVAFGHAGAYAPQHWPAPKKDSILILMIQPTDFPNAHHPPSRHPHHQ